MNITDILKSHKQWLKDKSTGAKANLSGADLKGASLRYVDLRDANLSCANLRGADLRDVDLRGADLRDVDLRGADLSCANLRYVDLRDANLSCVNLRGADLRDANLSCADLKGVSLRYVDLRDVNLRGASLRGAIMRQGSSTATTYICDGGYHYVTNIGSEEGTLELYSCGEKSWYIKRGCFKGTKEEFIAAVIETHGDNEHAKKYLAIIEALTS